MDQVFKGKRVTLAGLGYNKYGSGLSAAKFLLKAGVKLTVTDLKSKEDLIDTFSELDKFIKGLRKMGKHPQVKYVFGRHRQQDFIRTDWIMRNPRVPNRSLFLNLARQHNIPIDTDVSLFMQLCPAKVIGVTGTRGKSTTSALIAEMLKGGKHRVFLGGNIQYSPLNFLEKLKKDDWVVLELSSWQVESFEPYQIRPKIAVMLNLYPDHLNTYKGMADYALAKEVLLKFQNSKDFAVVNWDNQYTRRMGKRVSAQRYWFSMSQSLIGQNAGFIRANKVWLRVNGQLHKLVDLKNAKLLGDHNRANILAAAIAAFLAGASMSQISRAVKKFAGLPDRLELVKTIRGVKYYNDTTATTQEGTVAALKSFPASRIILIAGGSEKNLPFDQLAQEIVKRAKALILLDDQASFRIAGEVIKIKKDFPVWWAFDMTEAVRIADFLARSGEVVALSPACASFGLFKNEFDRGKKFIEAVKNLT